MFSVLLDLTFGKSKSKKQGGGSTPDPHSALFWEGGSGSRSFPHKSDKLDPDPDPHLSEIKEL